MHTEQQTEMFWLSAYPELSLQELAYYSGLSEAEILACIEEGAIRPVAPWAPQLSFSAHYQLALSAARRLRDDFDLNLDSKGLAVVITLLKHIHALEKQLTGERVQNPVFS